MASLEKAIQGLRGKIKELRRGDADEGVAVLQRYLAKYGFLTPSAPARMSLLERTAMSINFALETPLGQFEVNTEAALRRAQKFYGLPDTGRLDEATVQLLGMPRYDHHPDVPQFVIAARWDHRDLTYKFLNDSAKVTAPVAREAVRLGFQTWQRVSRLTFQEVGPGEPADCEILWTRGEHGDGTAFDGASGVLAHAFFPPPRGSSFPGDIHFDDDEAWSASAVALPQMDLVTVAAHEIGHAIGLDHSQDRKALMFPFYGGAMRDAGKPQFASLDQDDIDGINTLYP